MTNEPNQPIGELASYSCARCGHVWVPRIVGRLPVRCPNCTSYAWNRDLKKAGSKPKSERGAPIEEPGA